MQIQCWLRVPTVIDKAGACRSAAVVHCPFETVTGPPLLGVRAELSCQGPLNGNILIALAESRLVIIIFF
jgi:hypothetical protein